MNRRGFLTGLVAAAAVAPLAALIPRAAAVVVDGAGQFGSRLTISGMTGRFELGDVITISGRESVNRLTGEGTGLDRQFVVTGVTGRNLEIYPRLIPAGERHATVVAGPEDGAEVSLAGHLERPFICGNGEFASFRTAPS